jgi:hypothetical protein
MIFCEISINHIANGEIFKVKKKLVLQWFTNYLWLFSVFASDVSM